MEPISSFKEATIKNYYLEMQHSLLLLEAANKAPYYDSKLDQLNKKNYYTNIRVGTSNKSDLYMQLSEQLNKTHKTKLGYNDARYKHLYPNVDLQPNQKLKSIYSGKEFTPGTIIRSDFEIFKRIINTVNDKLSGNKEFSEAGFSKFLATLEADATYNTEHVIPQSWFAKKDPMKGDLHHLFTCEILCNEFRANTPFFDFPDFNELTRIGCGKKEENKFEPSRGHGPVARATLYFLLRYPKYINNNSREYTKDRIPVLLKWHKNEAVSLYELHRNAEIFKVQGNRNPLIDHPEWSDKINFISGLG
ncbi:MAG: endonuclease [Chitinophagaceae bacterium]